MPYRKTVVLLLAVLPALALGQVHPNLFYGAGDVSTLRERAASTHGYIARGLESGTDQFLGSKISSNGIVTWASGGTFDLGDKRDVGNGLAVFAFVWQLDGGAQYLALAKDWLLTVASFPSLDLAGDRDLVLAHVVFGATIAYDILYPQLTDAERVKVRAAITEGAGKLYAYGQGGGWWEREFLQNHNWINHAAVGLAGLALASDAELAPATRAAWIDYATRNARTVKAVTDPITDGTWHEGPGYLGYGYMFQLPYVTALVRAGGEDLTDMAILRGDAAQRAHGQIWERPHQKVLTYADFYDFGIGEGLTQLRFAASRYKDGVAQAVADRQVAGTARYTYAVECMEQIFEFLFYDPSVAPADLGQLPLDWYGDDLGAVVWRSGWDKGATLFAMKSGPMGGKSVWERIRAGVPEVQALNIGHDHADDNGFYLFGNGQWLAPEALGYYIGHPESPGEQANRTVYHNALTVDGVGQSGEGVRSTDGAVAFKWYFERTGGITFHASSRTQAYAVAEGAKLYPSSIDLDRWDRHALFLDRTWVVIRDVVRARSAHDFHYIAHFLEGAAQEGSWVRGTAQDGQSLGVAVVSPASWSLQVTQQRPNRIVGLNKNGYAYAAEVVPSTPASAVDFLTVLVPTPSAAWASRPSVAPLDPARPGVGLVLTSGARVARVIFADDPSGTPSAGGLALTGLTGAAISEGGALRRVLLVQATSLSQNGRTVATHDDPSAMLEADGLDGAEVRLTGDVLGHATFVAPSATRVTWYGADVPFVRDGEVIRVNENAPPIEDPNPGPGGNGNVPDPGPGGSPTTGTPHAPFTFGAMSGGCSAGAATLDLVALLGLAGALRRRRARK